ncbi:MAG: Rpn family recombination-promoting nuclease/putative transposase [Mariprofundaceae bacterium]|nr:Rpn family recombination-promoting nuclease/putative transposase [Mariprofundaceae bacterium]
MRFLNPKTDFAFKRIFGSAESNDILISFLNAILSLQSPHRIAEVDIIDPYLAPKIKGMKDTYLDIKAKDESGKSYIIEMQVLNVEGFEQRVLYNACKAYAGQLHRGDAYHKLTDVIAITITDFIMFEELAGVVNDFKLRAENGYVYHDDLELVFAELPKFNKGEDELKNDLDRWFYFLKSASDLEAVPKSMVDDTAIQHAFRIANKAGLSPEELDDQEHREIFIQDQRGALSLAKKQGLEQGDSKARIDIAQSLLAILDDHAIAKSTGLRLEEVQRLREGDSQRE